MDECKPLVSGGGGPGDGEDDTSSSTSAKMSTRALEATAVANESLVMFLAAAVLGPLLDHQHSRFDILHYQVGAHTPPLLTST